MPSEADHGYLNMISFPKSSDIGYVHMDSGAVQLLLSETKDRFSTLLPHMQPWLLLNDTEDGAQMVLQSGAFRC